MAATKSDKLLPQGWWVSSRSMVAGYLTETLPMGGGGSAGPGRYWTFWIEEVRSLALSKNFSPLGFTFLAEVDALVEYEYGPRGTPEHVVAYQRMPLVIRGGWRIYEIYPDDITGAAAFREWLRRALSNSAPGELYVDMMLSEDNMPVQTNVPPVPKGPWF
jgi:hypothetical protein